ncbi:hypothetical protein [Hymenobacter sediminicola]|uniref:Uncharacterized protein n=1 Tax=Hymenobacter sediminicola TaxID=2761579 RepID=A0A7G7W5J7_9BACT|nr:hypothetical protein [Hymenobacter sediminicola]QNH61640.1 hypothetical protein H4317_15975 [Hymenobacter sediminicola]
MKHGLTFLLLLLSTLNAWAIQPASSTGQRETTFRSQKLAAELRTTWLGMPRQSFRRLVPEQRLGAPTSISYYTRPGEPLTLGGYRVTGISYGFYKDQLCCIEVRVLGEANCRGIQALLTRSYGPGSAATGQRWENAQLRLLYNEMPKGYATVVVVSPSLLARYQAEQMTAPNEAV